ncbi:MAG TPA: hypothetical protein DCE44_09915, partial [Verrucomicrobiales bacterium]|nr:hypothetical protein [Verrucomicrobiales bacterium]
APVDFKKQVRSVLEVYCLKCHGDEKPKGGLSLTTRSNAIKGGDDGTSLVPGDPQKSPLYTLTVLPADHDDVMPPKGDKLSQAQQDTLKQWITEGAPWPDGIKLQQRDKVDFVKQVKPIFEVSCVACHKEGHAKGDLRLDAKDAFFASKAIVPGDALVSKVYTSTILPADHDDLMPPAKKGGPLPVAKTDLIRDWIDQGAVWPDGLKLEQKEADSSSTDRDWPAVIAALHALLVKNANAEALKHQNYRESISPEVGFDMIAIQGGEFEMGSADDAPGHKPDESPRRKVKLDPFWMGRCEVTWNEYELFQFPGLEKGNSISTERVNRELLLMTAFPKPADGGNPYVGKEADAVSRPTTPYVEMSFGMGKDGFPAISMTHYAALMYCRWLSAKTGHFYRLATEAEWEYAARAGTQTTYFWGDDVSKADEYAWSFNNSEGKYQKVGQKKPNPWGLYDMLGNVAEWVTDGFKTNAYSILPNDNPVLWGFAEYPHVARGGSWDDEPDKLRCARRLASEPAWKMRDPQLPKSRWYLTDAQFLGWRVVRPLKVPKTPEELAQWWTTFPATK